MDWDAGRLLVRSSKTEGYAGKAERAVPILPELRPLLLDAFEAAEPGAEWVVGRYRQRNANLRTQLQRILRRAGVEPWPRLFHNLRASCQTELAERFPAHVVSAWIGNSEAIAAAHYLQVTDDHFRRAVAEGAAQNPAHPVAQNAAQHRSAPGGTGPTNRRQPKGGGGVARVHADRCASMQRSKVTPAGFEPASPG